MSDTIEINTKGLDAIIKALKKTPSIRIGVLGDKNARTTGLATSNATVGAAHEFGTENLPIRSFLRMPLTDNLQKFLEQSNAFDPDAVKRVIAESSIMVWFKKVAVVAERVVAEAFDTGGFGKWKPSDMTKKKVQQTLVETQQLRNSITSEVKE